MTDLIPLATGKLDDPILMDWALHRYRDPRIGDPRRRRAMKQAWFDGRTCLPCPSSRPSRPVWRPWSRAR